MMASTTQVPRMNSNQATRISPSKFLLRPLSTCESEALNNYIQQEYGAMWGTLKFEDSLGDYFNEVFPFTASFEQQEYLHCSRNDHFSMLMIILIYMYYDSL